MLQWLSERLPFLKKDKSQDSSAASFETTSSARADHFEPAPREKQIAREEPTVVGGLPDDFWTVLRYYPYTIESCRLDEIRKSPEYAIAKRRYEEELEKERQRAQQCALERQRAREQEEQANRLSGELIEIYYEDLESYIQDNTNTTAVSQSPLLSRTRETLRRPL